MTLAMPRLYCIAVEQQAALGSNEPNYNSLNDLSEHAFLSIELSSSISNKLSPTPLLPGTRKKSSNKTSRLQRFQTD